MKKTKENLVLFSGIFHSVNVWGGLLSYLGAEYNNIVKISPYKEAKNLNPDKEYIAITTSYGYREYLKYRDKYTFKKGIHISPAQCVRNHKVLENLVKKMVKYIPQEYILEPNIFNSFRFLTGDNYCNEPAIFYSNIKNKENIKIMSDLKEVEDTVIQGDIYITNKKDRLVKVLESHKEFESGHNAILYNNNLFNYIKREIKLC